MRNQTGWKRIALRSSERLLLGMSCVLVLAGDGAAAEVPGRAPLTARVVRPTRRAHAGETTTLQVKITNVSGAAVAVAFDGLSKSFFFRSESNGTISYGGVAAGGVADAQDYKDGCPGDIPTFLLGPGQQLVQLVAVPIPTDVAGAVVRVNLTLNAMLVGSDQRCGSAQPLELGASTTVRIAR